MKMSLIEFSIENFKIFKNRVTFSTEAWKSEHTFENNSVNLLKTSLIYGPNASGKSTLLEALLIMKHGIMNSANSPEDAPLPYQPFLLSDKKDEPVKWEIIFSLNKKVLRYNFSILRDRIITENLFEILSNGKEKRYLARKEQKIEVFDDFMKSEDVISKTRKEVLFVSAASQWNNEFAMEIVESFRKYINVINGLKNESHGKFTMDLFKKNEDARNKIINLLKKADFCISDGYMEKIEIPEKLRKQMMFMNDKEFPQTADTIAFSHAKFNSKEENIGFEKINLGAESIGTQKFFDVLGPVIDTIDNGKVLFIDEFDNSLHPLLTKFIVDIFEKNNPKNAQLIVTTHDTSLLSYKDDFDKAQFWFTEKDKFGVGNLFSLAEFKLRNNTEYSKKYLEGRFGALPFIGSI